MLGSEINKVRLIMHVLVYALAVLFFISIANISYLLFHSTVEVVTVAVAWGIFMVAWNTRRGIKDSFFPIIGMSFLFSSVFDLLHVFTYQGMSVLASTTTNQSTQLWVAARYFQAFAFLFAPQFIGKKAKDKHFSHLFLALFIITILSIFYWKIFPQAYVEGVGLTAFKRLSEYVISLSFIFAIYKLWEKRDSFDKRVFSLLTMSLSFAVLAELSFTNYVSVFSPANFTGHIFKVIEYYLFYRAIIVIGVSRPYDLLYSDLIKIQNDLKKEKETAQKYLDLANVIFLILNQDGTVKLINRKGSEIIGLGAEAIIGKNWFDCFIPIQIRENMKSIFGRMVTDQLTPFEYYENAILTSTGEERIIAWRNTFLRENGEIQMLSTGEDITDYKKFQNQVLELSERVNGQRHLPIGNVVEDTIRDVN